VEKYGRFNRVLPDVATSVRVEACGMNTCGSTLAARAGLPRAPRLPVGICACLFDLDGVLTQTARLHELAWKETFDAFLRARSRSTGETFVPFRSADYDRYVDGRPRSDGVRTFLASRGLELPQHVVKALGDGKNERVLDLMRRHGVGPYPDALQLVRALRDAGLRLAVVSSSANCRRVLAAANLDGVFDAYVDGAYARERNLEGKPAPDTFLAAAAELGLRPEDAAVFEDALAGVAAGRAGGFGLVVGVDRTGQAEALLASGADVVVSDLTSLLESP
jgi:beta-phosphoglucomutase family hydrolase